MCNLIQHKRLAKILVTVINVSAQRATIGEGLIITVGSSEHSCFPSDTIYTIEEKDPIDFLCSDEKLGHLVHEPRYQVRTVSNAHIGKTTVNEFDICTVNLHPVADLLRRVPLHKETVVKKHLEKYEGLALIEKTDSPFRASTVLVAKKNVADSVDLIDKYRLYAEG